MTILFYLCGTRQFSVSLAATGIAGWVGAFRSTDDEGQTESSQRTETSPIRITVRLDAIDVKSEANPRNLRGGLSARDFLTLIIPRDSNLIFLRNRKRKRERDVGNDAHLTANAAELRNCGERDA